MKEYSVEEIRAMKGRKGAKKASVDIKQAQTLFLAACEAHGLPAPVPELVFCVGRKWRFDWAWDGIRRVALEIEGGVFMKEGGHRGMGRFLRDMEKYNEAAIMGWVVIRVTTDQVDSGVAFALVRRALGIQQGEA